MSHRIERVARLVRDVVSEALLQRVSDPRVSRFTSITRVGVAADLSFADVHFSVMGSEADQRTTLRGLISARGMIQSILAKSMSTRTCPTLRFHLDDSIKKGIATIRQLEELGSSAGPTGEEGGKDRSGGDEE